MHTYVRTYVCATYEVLLQWRLCSSFIGTHTHVCSEIEGKGRTTNVLILCLINYCTWTTYLLEHSLSSFLRSILASETTRMMWLLLACIFKHCVHESNVFLRSPSNPADICSIHSQTIANNTAHECPWPQTHTRTHTHTKYLFFKYCPTCGVCVLRLVWICRGNITRSCASVSCCHRGIHDSIRIFCLIRDCGMRDESSQHSNSGTILTIAQKGSAIWHTVRTLGTVICGNIHLVW